MWSSLFDLSIHGPCFTIGDYNVVLGAHETLGNPSASSCMEYAATISLCNWVELDSQGPFHTWHSTSACGIVFSKLDWAFCNEEFLDSWLRLVVYVFIILVWIIILYY